MIDCCYRLFLNLFSVFIFFVFIGYVALFEIVM